MLTEEQKDSILRIDIVEGIEETPQGFSLLTKEFACRNQCGGSSFRIPEGRIFIRTDKKYPRVRIFHRSKDLGLSHNLYWTKSKDGHPHVFRNGGACFGNAKSLFYSAVRNEEYVLAANYICMFLKVCYY